MKRDRKLQASCDVTRLHTDSSTSYRLTNTTYVKQKQKTYKTYNRQHMGHKAEEVATLSHSLRIHELYHLTSWQYRKYNDNALLGLTLLKTVYD